MSELSHNPAELICLNRSSSESLKEAIKDTVLDEIITRIVEQKPFTMTVRFDEFENTAIFGDWAAIRFDPPKPQERRNSHVVSNP